MAPRVHRHPAVLPVEEVEDQDLVVLPEPSNAYKKQVMPAYRIEIRCEDCGSPCYVHVDDLDSYDAKARQELFVARGGSYKPALCMLCKRARKRKKQHEEAA